MGSGVQNHSGYHCFNNNFLVNCPGCWTPFLSDCSCFLLPASCALVGFTLPICPYLDPVIFSRPLLDLLLLNSAEGSSKQTDKSSGGWSIRRNGALPHQPQIVLSWPPPHLPAVFHTTSSIICILPLLPHSYHQAQKTGTEHVTSPISFTWNGKRMW